MRDMTKSELNIVYDNGRCPHCGSEMFQPGPRGGMMQNIKCCGCGMELNVVDPAFSQTGIKVGQILSEPEGYSPKPD